MSASIHILGLAGSPYTRKLVAALRYRRIPYTLEWRHPMDSYKGRIAPKPPLLPTVYFGDDPQPVTDTTPIIRWLEGEHAARSILPDSPVLRLINSLIEDYADEWLTKAMFHYRWQYEADIAYASDMLIYWAAPTMPPDQAAPIAKQFGDRQISRLGYVGSNEVTGPIIEAGYLRFLDLMNDLIQRGGYVLGDRPSSADFALYGQLTQLTSVDPTPSSEAEKVSLRLRAWVERLDDLSGLEEGSWRSDPALVQPLLAEIGRVYAPLLLANAAALEAGEEMFSATVDGAEWRQNSFPYQRKCLTWLRDEFAALTAKDKTAALAILDGTGCEPIFTGG